MRPKDSQGVSSLVLLVLSTATAINSVILFYFFFWSFTSDTVWLCSWKSEWVSSTYVLRIPKHTIKYHGAYGTWLCNHCAGSKARGWTTGLGHKCAAAAPELYFWLQFRALQSTPPLGRHIPSKWALTWLLQTVVTVWRVMAKLTQQSSSFTAIYLLA